MPDVNLYDEEALQLEISHLAAVDGITVLFELALEGDQDAERRLIRIVHKLAQAEKDTARA